MDLFEMYKTKQQTQANKKRPATNKQIEFAEAIAEELGIEGPDFDDFSETSKFISDNADLYYDIKDDDDDWMYDGCGNGK